MDPSNELFFSWDQGSSVLRIGNKDSRLERSSLLLGASTKTDDERTIGQFGEGYKLALIVLLRQGHKVTIFNHACKEKWTASLVHSRTYKSKILRIVTSRYIVQRVPDHNLVFEISDVKEKDYESLKEFNLNLMDPGEVIDTIFGQILLGERFKRKVYVRGLYVSTVKDEKMGFGYNFKPEHMSLDRDRCLVSNFDVFWVTSKMWGSIQEDPRVLDMIKNGYSDVQYLTNSMNTTKISQLAADDFKREHGSKAFPVSSNEELKTMKKSYPKHKPVIVSSSHAHLIKSSGTLFAPIKKESNKKNISPKTHLESLFKKVKRRLSVTEFNKFSQIIEMSEDWRWK